MPEIFSLFAVLQSWTVTNKEKLQLPFIMMYSIHTKMTKIGVLHIYQN